MMCKRCTLAEEIHGDVTLDEEGICNYCNAYEDIREPLNDLPTMEAQLKARFEEAKRKRIETGGEYDVLVPVSGGKDSSYLLLALARDFELKVLAVTGTTMFSHPQAMTNVEHLCEKYGIDHQFVEGWEEAETKLARKLMFDMGSVCPACFGAFARIILVGQEKGVPAIVMGDSRDQMFDGSPTLTAAGIRKGHLDNTLEYGERDYWWVKTYSKIFEGLGGLVRQTLADDPESRDACIAPFEALLTYEIPDFIPFYFFKGHNELQMVKELEEAGWVNLDKGMLGHPDCVFQQFSRNPVEQSRSMGVYIREGVLDRKKAVRELIRDLTASLARDDEAILKIAAEPLGMAPNDFKGCEWLEVGKEEQKELARQYLKMLEVMPEANA